LPVAAAAFDDDLEVGFDEVFDDDRFEAMRVCSQYGQTFHLRPTGRSQDGQGSFSRLRQPGQRT
jgi:hypothetical protein